MRKILALILAGLVQTVPCAGLAEEIPADISQYRDWVLEMQDQQRGPFARLKWFCNDGSVRPPYAYACLDRGGGYQHGDWSEKTLELRQQGYLIANILAGLDAVAWVDDPDFANRYAQILIERFLISADDGWIMRHARFYRGAIQEADERSAARSLLLEMCARDHWIGPAFVALRAGVRLLPHGVNNASIQQVRKLSTSLSDQDAGFITLRAKIHGTPGVEDAASVREYAAGLPGDADQQAYLELAAAIDAIYQAAPLDTELESMAARHAAAPWLQELLSESASALRSDTQPAGQFRTTGKLLADLRTALPRVDSAPVRLDILDLSLRVEVANFNAANAFHTGLATANRQQRVRFLESAAQAAFGTGVINARLFEETQKTIAKLSTDAVGLDTYMRELNFLGRAPGWGTQAMRMHFYQAMEKLAGIEPKSTLFIQEQLRGSPLLVFAKVLDGLSHDANQLADVKHRLFDEVIDVGFTALNPGLANGVLHVKAGLGELENFRADGIYLLPETLSYLPPVAGILTGGEGNPFSHVQILARNLGIPHVTLDAGVIAKLAKHDGKRVVLAVSKSGLVEISPWSDSWNKVFKGKAATNGLVINADLEKLDLTKNAMLSLDDLRARDAGRTVGPKTANLGELRSRYPGNVSRGVAIPFGTFRREVFEQPHPGGGGSVFRWMVKSYEELAAIPADDPERASRTEAFRAELHAIVLNTPFSAGFKEKLKTAMEETFGSYDPPGVFVRADTNVEDLAGFTGAGLTLPNVVGHENLQKAISEAWASPFTARAFASRQLHMTQPEHVYTSVLLLESVAADKSGVLVTQDIDTGNRNVISVAVNEGLGGALDGQAAESLRILLDGSSVRAVATATAPWRKVPDPTGGLILLPVSGSDTILQPAEIQQIIDFAQNLPKNFPAITDDAGKPAPVDVEFGFLRGELRLFQLRPFLDSEMAMSIGYLQKMAAPPNRAASIKVDMNGVPGR